MDYLRKFGVLSGEDLQHANQARLSDYPHVQFAEQATHFLEEISETVRGNVRDILEKVPGKWNPGGFMVFPLGLLEDGSSVRFHVWAQGLERKTDQGPNPHDHALHLSSRVLAESYTDDIMVANELDEIGGTSLSQLDIYGRYSTHRGKDGRDSLVYDGTLVRAEVMQRRTFKEGETHHIPFGDYHFAPIPKDQLLATLVLDSPSFKNSSGVLLKSKEREILRVRRNILDNERKLAIEQLTQKFNTQ